VRPRELRRCVHGVRRHRGSPERDCDKPAHLRAPWGDSCCGHYAGRPEESHYLHAPETCTVCDRQRARWQRYDEFEAQQAARRGGLQ